MFFKIIFSIIFASLTIINMFFNNINIKIDTTTIILVILAFVPWIIQYIKSFEISGLGKIELIKPYEKSKIETNIKKLENSNSDIEKKLENKYLLINDKLLALTAIRIDIETALNKIAEDNGIDSYRKGISNLAKILKEKELINNYEYALIFDLLNILNRAAHGRITDYDDINFEWIFDIGAKTVTSLNSVAI